MRLLDVTGPGGAGATTVAAATAVHGARCGVKTLAVSLAGPALRDLLRAPREQVQPGVPVEVAAGLSVLEVDARAQARRTGPGGLAADVLEAIGVDPLEPDDIAALPGAAETLALLELCEVVRQGRWDLVVVDAPAHTAAVGGALTSALGRMLPMERRVTRALSAQAQAITGRDGLVEAVERWLAELGDAQTVLADAGASWRLVLTPDCASLTAARRLLTTLRLHGQVIDGAVVNQAVPAPPDGEVFGWQAGWVAAQTGVLAEARESLAPLPVHVLPHRGAGPVGLDALAELAELLYGAPSGEAAGLLLAAPVLPPAMAVEPAGTGYELVLDLRLADRDELDLARRDDELVVTVAEQRRVVTLPSALRRCLVVGARLTDGRLRVRFEPDPALWRPM